jgi:hypothetical protein
MRAVALVLLAATTAWAGEDVTVARVERPPQWPIVELHTLACEKGGQKVFALHGDEGPIKGCWVRAMGAVLVIWDDGDATIFKDGLFFPAKEI